MADAEPQDAFMYFSVGSGTGTPIEGETADKKLKDKKAFELLEFSVKSENSTNIGSSTGGAGGAGKVKFDRLSLKKYADKCTVAFFKALSMGGHYDEAFIELRRNNEIFLKYSFLMCVISEVESSQSGDDEAEDSIVVDYGAIKIEYFAQDIHGKFKPAGDMMWSRVLNDPDYAVE